MKLCNIGHDFHYEIEKLIRLYLPFEKIENTDFDGAEDLKAVCIMENAEGGALLKATLYLNGKSSHHQELLRETDSNFKRDCEIVLAANLYYCFADLTDYRPDWGILTGVRPARLFSRVADEMGVIKAKAHFADTFKVNDKKISLCEKTLAGEEKIISLSKPDSFSLYISVPFCPSRCSYCSFVSHSVDKALDMIPIYVDYLCKEIEYTASLASKANLKLETVYMGGGTPTTLSAEQLKTVFSKLYECFDMENIMEFTVEAGRPDTITEEKLKVIKEAGATRISINPQTLNDNVLEQIGRKHTAKQTCEAFALARAMGFDNINMDLIAGLPGDTFESFADTVEKIIKLDPESVTVHSLSMKRASFLTKKGEFPEIDMGKQASRMVDFARKRFEECEILPYYMYRQSKTVGNLENVGYAKKGFEGLYNVYIMDETHTILACGASAVTKLKEPNGDFIQRIFNFKYPYEYINRFDEQLERKKEILNFYNQYPTY